ncbi:MAG: tRNA 2-thiouridine(34) synthase MnmA [Bacilli bacterium]|nr:tRNA 2-thiouridine(34) synthase MnmA [Bacilli bacterium]MBN2877383.1 tRNA 2-thiouridine(34) synthase MnmA [Bacilli bacterium]
MKKKVIVGLSGGVDSSVCAYLLLKQGYEVEGLFMRNWDSAMNNDILGNPDLDNDICPQEEDYMDALAVANHLGILLHRHDFVQEYWDNVFTYFIDEYKKGRTPNPDILCNKYIKFATFREVAAGFGADFYAYGHYARTRVYEDEVELLRGIDNNKDQTYFLSQLTQEQLQNTLFPVGELEKSEVRKIAIENRIPTAKKKDSTGICFIGERNFRDFLKNYIYTKPGPIQADDGKIIGTHDGLMYYTIGQRKGLGLGGLKEYENLPWFVIGKDLEQNILFVGQGINHPTLFADQAIIEDVNWIPKERFTGTLHCTAKFRYRQKDTEVALTWLEDGTLDVKMKQDVRAVTPGQAAVFYDGDVCLGGGVIQSAFYKGKIRKY